MNNFHIDGPANCYVSVFPESTHKEDKSWNAGSCCSEPMKKNIDDIGYIREVVRIVSLHKTLPGDSSSIFVNGASNGGLMTSRLGCELNGVKAISPQIGGFGLKK